MKTDWSMWGSTGDSTAAIVDHYATTSSNTISTTNKDMYDAICYAAIRRMDMEEKKARGVSFNELEKILRKMGIFLTEIRQDSYNDYAEITCKVNPIDWYTSLDKKDTPATKDWTPHPKKVIFSGPATTILWMDGTKTTVKCQRHDIYNKDTGIAMCYLKKMLGNKGNYNNIFREAMKVSKDKTVCAIETPKKED